MPTGERWHTHDGKIHYRSQELQETGNDALPILDALILPYETDETFPFWLSSGDRVSAFQHGQYRQVAVYKDIFPEPILDIHPDAASRLGILQGSVVVLSTRCGKVDVRANLSEKVRQDCLRMTHGWEEVNANELGLAHLDKVSGFPWYKALPARIERRSE